MNDNVFDLDKLVPEPKKIKLSGKILDLYPGKLKTIVKLQRAFASMRDGNGDPEEVINILSTLIPQIKDDDVDINVSTQLPVLVKLAYEVSLPNDAQQVREQNMTPSTEKKTEETLNEQSPTSSENTQATS